MFDSLSKIKLALSPVWTFTEYDLGNVCKERPKLISSIHFHESYKYRVHNNNLYTSWFPLKHKKCIVPNSRKIYYKVITHSVLTINGHKVMIHVIRCTFSTGWSSLTPFQTCQTQLCYNLSKLHFVTRQ